jgi:hypothetical protein
MELLLQVPPRLIRGIVFLLLGVGFWASGFVVANWVWKRYRGEE